MGVQTVACKSILEKIVNGEVKNAKELTRAKLQACREFGLSKVPKNSDILAVTNGEIEKRLTETIVLKPTRSISGVSVITAMMKPYPCPKKTPCIYCPGGPSKGTTQSYTGKEPASARALQHNYDPYAQVKARINQLRTIGHRVDKVELLMIGGTLTAYPLKYLEQFVRECLNAISSTKATNLEEAQKTAENAKIHVSDISLETRPDYCKEPQVDLLLKLGATRVELGVQTVYDEVYKLINREHTVEDVVEATRIAKDAGFAIIYHTMLGLLGSSYEKDLGMFTTIFNDGRFKPDAIKIYPTLIMEGTKLHELWLQGKYRPYPLEQVIELIAEIKKRVPEWVRIQRIQRDIPANLITDGVKRGDLRMLVQGKLRGEGSRCRCIRCREAGHVEQRLGVKPGPEDIKLMTRRYSASGGEEVFLSYEDTKLDILVGLLRLRYPSEKAHRLEVKESRCTLVRELHVYGPLLPVHAEPGDEWQHRGYGKQLLNEAERISREEFDVNRVAVLSGMGVRNYYRRLGYGRNGPYMVKELS
jgi:elongator complex protein 3